MTFRTSWHARPRAARIAIATAGVLLLVLTLLWLMRVSIAEWAVEGAIDDFGLGPADVEISRLGTGGAEMRLVASGMGTIERIALRYRIGRLLGGQVDSARIEGARLSFAWRDGALVPPFRSSDGPVVLPIGTVDIVDSRLTLDLEGEAVIADVAGRITSGDTIAADLALAVSAPQGALKGRIAGSLAPDGGLSAEFSVAEGRLAVGSVTADALSGQLRVSGTADRMDLIEGKFGFQQIQSAGRPLGPGTLSASLRQPENILTVALESEPVTATFRADGRQPAGGVPFTLAATADAGFLGSLAGAAPGATGTLRLDATGTSPAAADLTGVAALGLGDWLREGKAEGSLAGNVSGLNIPENLSLKQAALSLDLTLFGGGLTMSTADGLSVDGLTWADTPADSPLDGGVDLAIRKDGDAPFLAITPGDGDDALAFAGHVTLKTPALSLRGKMRADATLDPAQWQAAARDTVATGTFTLRSDAALELTENRSLPASDLVLAGRYAIGPAEAAITLDEGRISASRIRWGETLRLPGPARAELEAGAAFTQDRATGTITGSAVLRPFSWKATLAQEDGEPASVTIAARRMTVTADADGQRVVLENGRVELPGSEIAATGIAATIALVADTTTARATIAELRSTAEPALFPALRTSVDARLTGDRATFTATVADRSKTISATAKGRHDLASGTGQASVTLKPVDLSGEGTIATLSPSFAQSVNSATGTIAGEGTIHWGENAPPGTLTVTMADVGVDARSVKASSFNGTVRLDSLMPLTTPPGQRIAGTLQLPTVDLVPIDVTFHLEPGKLVLENATAEVFGGTFSTRNAVLDSATGDGSLDLKISDMNLETAFAVLDLEQLKGTGRIGGTLPLRIRDGKVAVEDGHLESSVPGTVQVGVTALADQLQSYGENVDMAFRALTDFHYTRMTIDTSKPYAGAGTALFRLEGNNPAVMEGQPFIFNIRLETDFDYLTQLLLELSGAANTALGWGARELVGD